MLETLAANTQPDVICIQETKTPDEFFPMDAVRAMGYDHVHINGMKSYNGVAILSRIPFQNVDVHNHCGNADCRHISISLESSKLSCCVNIHSLYIPAGGYEADPVTNDKFQHKLDFVDEMTAWFAKRYTKDDAVILTGDLNIAPLEHDVWSHKQMVNVVSHTPAEVTRFKKMQDSIGFYDAIRHFVPEDEKCFTWWSYRSRDWKKSNRGRRLDHIWVTDPVQPSLEDYAILREARDWERPSDHVPILIDVDL